MNMSLPEKKISPRPSLYRESYKTARLNMILAVLLWSGITTVVAIIQNRIFFASNSGWVLMGFAVRTIAGIMVSVIPTIIGAKALSVWLKYNKVTQKSARMAGAVTGVISIFLLTVPVSIFMLTTEMRDFAYTQPAISLFVNFDLPIGICAALAGGRTGFQLAKFIEAQNQTSIESAQEISTLTETRS